jgi:hypothetical protein
VLSPFAKERLWTCSKWDPAADLSPAMVSLLEEGSEGSMLAWLSALSTGSARALVKHPLGGGELSDSEFVGLADSSPRSVKRVLLNSSTSRHLKVGPVLDYCFTEVVNQGVPFEFREAVKGLDYSLAVALLPSCPPLMALFKLVSYLPAEVCAWHSSPELSRRDKLDLENLISSWVGPVVVDEQVRGVAQSDSLRVVYLKSTRQVSVSYAKGEFNTALTITYPPSWPLRPVAVELPSVAGLTKARVRHMQLSLQHSINNISLATALQQWVSNLDKVLEGVEDCVICYSIVHPETGSVPSKQCAVCKNKFHQECIFRWFRTSHKTTCPLCQSSF